jgi:hypothetical protein
VYHHQLTFFSFLLLSFFAFQGLLNGPLASCTTRQQNTRLFLFLSELMDLFVAGRDQSAADQPSLAEGHPPLYHSMQVA